MAYNQYTPATTAYVEAAFKEYDTYIRERLSSDEKNIKKNAENIATNVSGISDLQTQMKTVLYTPETTS